MPQSPMRLIRRCIEYQPADAVFKVPPKLRGVYVLYRQEPASGRRKTDRYQVVYVGMATTGSIRSRLKVHRRRKVRLWTHFSVYEVWDNIRDDEIAELEGLFRHIYRLDPVASELNKQRGFKPIRQVRRKQFDNWHSEAPASRTARPNER
jgi:hypothetical protein